LVALADELQDYRQLLPVVPLSSRICDDNQGENSASI
jgi:hypothetical protein